MARNCYTLRKVFQFFSCRSPNQVYLTMGCYNLTTLSRENHRKMPTGLRRTCSSNSNSRLKMLELEFGASGSWRPEPQAPWEQGGFASVSGSPNKNAVFIWKWNYTPTAFFRASGATTRRSRPRAAASTPRASPTNCDRCSAGTRAFSPVLLAAFSWYMSNCI